MGMPSSIRSCPRSKRRGGSRPQEPAARSVSRTYERRSMPRSRASRPVRWHRDHAADRSQRPVPRRADHHRVHRHLERRPLLAQAGAERQLPCDAGANRGPLHRPGVRRNRDVLRGFASPRSAPLVVWSLAGDHPPDRGELPLGAGEPARGPDLWARRALHVRPGDPRVHDWSRLTSDRPRKGRGALSDSSRDRLLAALTGRLLGLLRGLLPGRHASPPYRVSGEPRTRVVRLTEITLSPKRSCRFATLAALKEAQLVDGRQWFRAQATSSEVHRELFVETEDGVRHTGADLLRVTTEFFEVGVVGEREDRVDLQAILEAPVHCPPGQGRRFEYAKLVRQAIAASGRRHDDDRRSRSELAHPLVRWEVTAELSIHFRHPE